MRQIEDAFLGSSLNAFYLPLFITKGDAYVGVQSHAHVITLHFKRMTFIQNRKTIAPSGTVLGGRGDRW
ncbi:hypothetical protein [Alicyclobacillus acidiphilus]|uniref:hypothetical protein n=1 Tax=Alicyclobacillus acidiphilus TaxID=182455 RepID=UPI000835BF71|nr:hypothetical protein [Alicyclobacillus acidiphilus]